MAKRLLGIPVMLLALAGLNVCLPAPAAAQEFGADDGVDWLADDEQDAGAPDYEVGLEDDDSMGLGEDWEFGIGDDGYGIDRDDFGLDDDESFGLSDTDDTLFDADNTVGLDDRRLDSYGAFDNEFAWETGDEGFDAWYGDSDLGWE